MKILHLGFSDTNGGAAIAMMRLHESLLKVILIQMFLFVKNCQIQIKCSVQQIINLINGDRNLR